MELQSIDTITGGRIFYKGSFDNKKVILIIGRDNFQKDERLIAWLVDYLYKTGSTIMWYEHAGVTRSRFMSSLSNNSIFPNKIIKAIKLLGYPKYWWHFLPRLMRPEEKVLYQVNDLREIVRFLGERELSIITRSAGGRIASKILDEPSVKNLVCLGYPFKHPDRKFEPDRVGHLATTSKPFLIVQGTHDPYGGEDVVNKYSLSKNISFLFVDTDHDFNLSDKYLSEIMTKVLLFINS